MEFQNGNDLDFLLVPLMSHSHLIPFTEVGKLLAHRGITVTIIMTPLNASIYSKIIKYAHNFNLNIQFLCLQFPSQEVGLPEGCENMDSVPSPNMIPKFFQASNLLQKPIENHLLSLQSKPSCIIADICLPWISDISLKFKIPRFIFHGISCFSLFCSHNLGHYKVLENVSSNSESFLVPNVPDRIELTKAQMPQSANRGSNHLKATLDRFKQAELSAEGVIVNSFEELELAYVEGYRNVVKKLWCIGPVSLQNNASGEANYEHELLRWLDSMSESSVLYVCFGSLCNIPANQLIELGLGLKESNQPFIWIVREGDYSKELDKWLAEENFEKSIEGRGVIFRGWAPQVLILSHHSIGGFVTHCGWNSTLEGISAGVPMITWPMFAEQFLTEKLIVQVLKIGVSVGAKVPMNLGEGDVLVKSREIKRAIENVMDKEEECEERRRKAKQLGQMAKRAIEEGGSSYFTTTLLIQHVKQLDTHHQQSIPSST